jgi:O-antigen/teichoic acid export membrane protein
MSKIQTFFKSTLVFFIGSAASRLVSFFLLPLYTGKIPAGDYGFYDLTITYIELFCTVVFFNVWTSVLRYMFDFEGAQKLKAVYAGLPVFALSCALTVLSSLAVAHILHVKYTALITLYAVTLAASYYYSFAARGFSYNILYAASGFVAALVHLAVSVVLLNVYSFDYSALYISYIAGFLAQIIIIEGKLKLIKNFSAAPLRLTSRIFSLSLPLSVNSAAFWFLTGINKVLVVRYLGAYANGLYAVAIKFGVVLSFVSYCAELAWQELAFLTGAKSEDYSFFSKAGEVYLKAAFAAAIVILPLIYLVFPVFINPAYFEARSMVPLYIIATLAGVYSKFLGSIFTGLKKTKTVFWSTAAAAAVNSFAAVALIRRLGVEAVNISLLLGYLANIAIRLIMLNKEIGFKVNYKIPALLIPPLVLAYIVYLYLPAYIWLFLFLSLLIAFLALRKEFFALLKGRRRA